LRLLVLFFCYEIDIGVWSFTYNSMHDPN